MYKVYLLFFSILLFAKENLDSSSLENTIKSTQIWSSADAKIVEKYLYDKNGHNYLARAQGLNLQYLGYHGQWLQLMDLTFVSAEISTKYLQYLYSRAHDLESRIASLEAKVKAGIGGSSSNTSSKKEISAVVEKTQLQEPKEEAKEELYLSSDIQSLESKINFIYKRLDILQKDVASSNYEELESKISFINQRYDLLQKVVASSNYEELESKISFINQRYDLLKKAVVSSNYEELESKINDIMLLLLYEILVNEKNIIKTEEQLAFIRIYDLFKFKKHVTNQEPETKILKIHAPENTKSYWGFLSKITVKTILAAHDLHKK